MPSASLDSIDIQITLSRALAPSRDRTLTLVSSNRLVEIEYLEQPSTRMPRGFEGAQCTIGGHTLQRSVQTLLNQSRRPLKDISNHQAGSLGAFHQESSNSLRTGYVINNSKPALIEQSDDAELSNCRQLVDSAVLNCFFPRFRFAQPSVYSTTISDGPKLIEVSPSLFSSAYHEVPLSLTYRFC